MSLRVKAIISGIVIEAVLLVLIVDGIVPTAPLKPSGSHWVAFFQHSPMFFNSPILPYWGGVFVGFALYSLSWSILVYGLLRLVKCFSK